MRNVAIVSVGQRTPSNVFVNEKIRQLKDEGCVSIVEIDVRDWLSKNPRDLDIVLNSLDGESPTTQRFVIEQEGFVGCVKHIVGTAYTAIDRATLADAPILAVVKCTAGKHRAHTTSGVGEEVLNAIEDNGAREFNAMHFAMAALDSVGKFEHTWKEVREWLLDAWAVKDTPPRKLSLKFGYKGAVQRKHGYEHFKEIWDYVSKINEDFMGVAVGPNEAPCVRCMFAVCGPRLSL